MTGTFRMFGRCDAASNWWPSFCDAKDSPDVTLDLGNDPQRLPDFQVLYGSRIDTRGVSQGGWLVPCECYLVGGIYYGRPLSGRWPE